MASHSKVHGRKIDRLARPEVDIRICDPHGATVLDDGRVEVDTGAQPRLRDIGITQLGIDGLFGSPKGRGRPGILATSLVTAMTWPGK